MEKAIFIHSSLFVILHLLRELLTENMFQAFVILVSF